MSFHLQYESHRKAHSTVIEDLFANLQQTVRETRATIGSGGSG